MEQLPIFLKEVPQVADGSIAVKEDITEGSKTRHMASWTV